MPEPGSSVLLESTNADTPPSTTRPFSGGSIILASTAILFVSSGIGFYGHGVMLDPLGALHGWSKTTISSAVTLYFFTSGIMGMIIGRQIDIYGPKRFLIGGSVVIGTGLVLLAFIHSVWQLYVVYFIMALGFSCTSITPVNTLIANWYIRKRGFAMSLTNTGLSVGGIVLVPFASFVIPRWGLDITLPVLGIFYMVVVIVSTAFVKQRPSDINQYPDGIAPAALPSDRPYSTISDATQMQVWTRRQAIGTMAFWSIVIAFWLALTGQIAFLIHQISFLSRYLGVSGAATAVSVTAVGSIVGRLWLGSFVDRLDKRHVAMMCFLMQGIAVITLAHCHHVVVLYLGTLAFGLTMGNILMLQALIIGECFGLVSFATVSGLAGVFVMAGAAFGPGMAGFIFDATRNYQVAFTLFAAMSGVAIFVIYFAKPPNPP